MADDADLRELYSQATGSSAADHVAEDVWEALACGELAAPELRAVKDHATRCVECSLIYRGLLEISQEAPRLDPGLELGAEPRLESSPSGRSWTSRFFLPGLAAAAGVLALVLLLPFGQRPDVEPAGSATLAPAGDQLRSTGAQRPRGLEPQGAVAETQPTLEWIALQGVAAYRVEVFDGEGEPLWKSEELVVPSAVLPAGLLQPGGLFYWRVLAAPQSGAPAMASELVSFELKASE